MTTLPEARARETIDRMLSRSGWLLQDYGSRQVAAGRGVAVREFPMAAGHGRADYLLFVDGQPLGALEAKKAGHTLRGVEGQAEKYSRGLPAELDAPIRPLPFLYLSTGTETLFANLLDPEPRSRPIFALPRPETLAEWLKADPLGVWLAGAYGGETQAVAEPAGGGALRPSTLRGRLRHIPREQIPGLWPNQQRAITNLEASLAEDRPRSLIQMATGSGKSLMAVVSAYRLIKFGGARRVLFLVDRANLGEQAENEFGSYRTYDDHRKLEELFTVQRLTGNKIRSASKVVIATIQRLYSMLCGEENFDPALEEVSAFELDPSEERVREVVYNPAIPPEYFDVIFIDECHRSIYTKWREVLEYFDAHLVGLTATPAKHTFGFFRQNLVMEYSHEEAVADGVNVDFDVYRIRTRITEHGSVIEAEPGSVRVRDRNTRADRWEKPDEDIAYTANQLDREVVAPDQIRLIVRTFRDRLFEEIFPGREHVPKTLIFAKDDSHAEDIVEIVREEFGKGNDFCSKITYKTTGNPKELINRFRTAYNPRIAVTVDMIATGTDVKPIEVVVFLRSVKSRVLYEQMKGRGTRVTKPDEIRAVTPDAEAKTHFVLIDCVGVTESTMDDTRPLDKKRSLSFRALLDYVAAGGTDPEYLSSLASRLTRLDLRLDDASRTKLRQAFPAFDLRHTVQALVDALDEDRQAEHARRTHGLGSDQDPTDEQLAAAAAELGRSATAPLAEDSRLRDLLIDLKRVSEQWIDETSQDELLESAHSPAARERARKLVQSFEAYVAEHKDEIEALQFFYSRPYHDRLRFEEIQALADTIAGPPRQWTPERLWRAYQQLDASRVRGAASQRLLTDLVSLVRYALHQDGELVPYAELVGQRFERWLATQQTAGRTFTREQLHWLELIRDHVAQSVEIEMEDFDLTPFVEQGGLGRAAQVFGGDLRALLRELNEALAA